MWCGKQRIHSQPHSFFQSSSYMCLLNSNQIFETHSRMKEQSYSITYSLIHSLKPLFMDFFFSTTYLKTKKMTFRCTFHSLLIFLHFSISLYYISFSEWMISRHSSSPNSSSLRDVCYSTKAATANCTPTPQPKTLTFHHLIVIVLFIFMCVVFASSSVEGQVMNMELVGTTNNETRSRSRGRTRSTAPSRSRALSYVKSLISHSTHFICFLSLCFIHHCRCRMRTTRGSRGGRGGRALRGRRGRRGRRGQRNK